MYQPEVERYSAGRLRAAPMIMLVSLLIVVSSSCGRGALPELIADDPLVTGAASIAETLAPAPAGTSALAVPPDMAWSPTIEDALDDWSQTISLDFRGDCRNPTFENDTAQFGGTILCSSASSRPNVVLLGPGAEAPWHVVATETSADGVRVTETAVAGS